MSLSTLIVLTAEVVTRVACLLFEEVRSSPDSNPHEGSSLPQLYLAPCHTENAQEYPRAVWETQDQQWRERDGGGGG